MVFHELLVVVALTGTVLGALYTVLEHGLRAESTGVARAESQQAARVALARLSAEIRVAGRGADATMPAILVAERARIVLASDLDADRDANGSGERITWQLAGSVLRRNAGGGAQPVANGVRAFELSYFDEAGRRTVDPKAVRTIEVALVIAPEAGASTLARGVTTRVSTRVRLRNR